MTANVEELLRHGNSNCAGCGMTLGLRWFGEALAGKTPTLVIPPCCATVTAGLFPVTAYNAPAAATAFASPAAVATGFARVQHLNGERTTIVCWTGDGSTYDIGLATVSAAAERNEDIVYVCYDNEIYGNTGGQRSGATPRGAKTSTTPSGKPEPKKDMMAIMAAHRVPYAATLSLAHRDDFLRKVQTALSLRGFRFLLMLSPCPSGWKSEPEETVELVRLAVGSGLFPLYEVYDGCRYRINAWPDGSQLDDYVSRQGRFKSKRLDVNTLRADIAADWRRLEAMASAFPVEEGPSALQSEGTGGADACEGDS